MFTIDKKANETIFDTIIIFSIFIIILKLDTILITFNNFSDLSIKKTE